MKSHYYNGRRVFSEGLGVFTRTMFSGYPLPSSIKSESVDFSSYMTLQWFQYLCVDNLHTSTGTP